ASSQPPSQSVTPSQIDLKEISSFVGHVNFSAGTTGQAYSSCPSSQSDLPSHTNSNGMILLETSKQEYPGLHPASSDPPGQSTCPPQTGSARTAVWPHTKASTSTSHPQFRQL